MFIKSKIVLLLFAVVVLVSLTVGIASAVPVTKNITYQGKLTDAAGNPLTGAFTVTFTLYNVSSGGTALATDSHSVDASKGLFTTQVTADSSYFDGRALWLGIKVGSDSEMTPRQEIRPVPYALGLRPGAEGTSLTTSKAGTGYNQPLPGLTISTSYPWNPGVRIDTTADSSYGAWITTHGTYTSGVYSLSYGNHSDGMQGYAFGPSGSGVYGESTNGTGVAGSSTNSYGVYGRGKTGGYFTTNQAGPVGYQQPGVNVLTSYDQNPGVLVHTSGQFSHGVSSTTTGSYSPGVNADTKGDTSSGIVAATVGNNSDGVSAVTYGVSSKGVSSYTYNDKSPAIYGVSSNDVGVYGKGVTGGFFTTNSAGGPSGADSRPGVNVSTLYNSNPGVSVMTDGGNSPGIKATTSGDYSHGVDVQTYGTSSKGLNVYANGPSSYGVYAISNNGYGLYASTGNANQKYGVYTPDYLYAKGTQVPATDVAEFMPVTGDATPGTVLVIGDYGKLQESVSAYDTRVAGIVSTEPGVTLGTKDGGNPGEMQVAVAGRVPCKVDATKTPIHAGDLLTTSGNPGYAMKAEQVSTGTLKFYLPGTVLGKAMGSLDSGTGTIEVLVTLQ
jgi:hypothetical protein